MFPANTLEEALEIIRRGLCCRAEVCDGDMVQWHGKAARVDTGLMYDVDTQIGTFAIVSVRRRDGEKQVVGIHIGSVGEMVANPITEARFDEWESQLAPWC
jgi:hypothetical protein